MSKGERYSIVSSFGFGDMGIGGMGFSATKIEEGSPADLATKDYYNSHVLLPEDHLDLSDEEVSAYGEALLSGQLSLKETKRAILVLAHSERKEALEQLQIFADIADPKLEGFLVHAIDECKAWIPANRAERRARKYRWN